MANKYSKPIFPSKSYSGQDEYIKQQMQDFYDDVMSQNSNFWAEANKDSLLEAGDQSTLNSLGFSRVLPYMDMYTSNQIKRIISLVSGVQRRNRKSTTVVPLENGDQKTADQFTKLIFNLNANYHVLETISDAFQSSLITGLSLIQTWVDFRDDPISGNINVDFCPYNTFIIDPYFKKPDLSDCRAIWKRSYLTKDECESLLPEHKSDIQELSLSNSGSDDIFPYLTSAYWVNTDFLAYDEFYYRDYRKQKKLIDNFTGETLEYTGQDDEILTFFLQQNPSVRVEELTIPTVKLAIVVNGHVMYNDYSPLSIDKYPFVPVFGYFSQNINDMNVRFQGLVRGMRDSQFLYNLMTSLEVEYVQSRVNPGVVYKPSSLIDDKAIKRRDLSMGIQLNKTATMDDVRFINPMEVPQTVPLIREQAAKDMLESDGGNEELFGSATDQNTAGILSVLRQSAGLTTLQPIMDALDRSQKILGQLQISLIQNNYTPGKVARIIEEQPTKQFYNKAFGKYDAAVEEGVNTTTQRQQQFTTLFALKQAGINIPDDILIKASTIQNKNDLMEMLQAQSQQQAQLQQQEAQANNELQQATAQLSNSKAAADMALAQERMAKIQDNRTQSIANLAEAKKDDEQATLDKIKALKELESIDFANLEKLLNLIAALKSTTTSVPMESTPLSQNVRGNNE